MGGSLADVWKCLKPVPNGLRVKWDDNVKKFELLQQITEVELVFHDGAVGMLWNHGHWCHFCLSPPGRVRVQNGDALGGHGNHLPAGLCGRYFS